VRVLLCDDDPIMVETLKNRVKDKLKEILPQESIYVSGFNNVFELKDFLDKQDVIVDAIFFDIMLNKNGTENGIEEAKKIKEIHPEINIIFCTGNMEYVEDVYDVEPLYLLIKPISEERLEKALLKLVKNVNKEKYLTIRLVGEIRRINLSTIFFAESQRKYVKIYTEEGCFSTLTKLDNVIEQLDNNFVRVHKSYIININKIKTYKYTSIILTNDVEVPVSRRYQPVLKMRMINDIP